MFQRKGVRYDENALFVYNALIIDYICEVSYYYTGASIVDDYRADINISKSNKPVVIAGAGVVGCVIGYELAKIGHKVIIVEKDIQVGGLAKSFHYDGFTFDIGPHRFHTRKEKISSYIYGILKDNFVTIPQNSSVFFLGKYYTWPLRPTIVFGLPLSITIKSAWELLLMALENKKKKICNFEDYILVNYGPTLYNIFFKEYTQKFLGLPTKKIHSEWAKEAMKRAIIDERISSRDLLDILKLSLRFKPNETTFIYPADGIGSFCEKLKEAFIGCGGEVLANNFIADIKYSGNKIEELSVNGMRIEPEMLIWTASLKELCRLFGLSCDGLNYIDLILYNVEVNNPAKQNYQWCYYGDRRIIFNRVTLPSRFHKGMVPEGKDSLCVEVNSHTDDAAWDNPELLIERVKRDLIKVGLVGRIEDIGNIHIEKVKDAYPIYTIDYPQRLKKVKESLSGFENLELAGRTALFWYNNMDDCIENGLETVRNIIRRK